MQRFFWHSPFLGYNSASTLKTLVFKNFKKICPSQKSGFYIQKAGSNHFKPFQVHFQISIGIYMVKTALTRLFHSRISLISVCKISPLICKIYKSTYFSKISASKSNPKSRYCNISIFRGGPFFRGKFSRYPQRPPDFWPS